MKKMQDQLEVIKEKIKSYGLNRENMRDLKKWNLNDLMNEEAEEQINASRYERNNNRKDLVRTLYYLDSYQVEYIEMDKYKLEYN